MLTVLARSGEGGFRRCEPTDLPGLLAAPDALVWVDLEGADASEVAVLSEVFGFHHLTIEDCLNSYVDPPKVDDYGDYLFVVVQGINFAASTGQNSLATTELNLYLGPSYVVTYHRPPMPSVGEVRERCVRGAPLLARGADWLAHAILDALVDRLLPAVQEMEREVAQVEDQVLDRPSRALMERLTDLKRSAYRFRRLVTPQREVVNHFARGDFPRLVHQETHMHFRDIYDHMVRIESMMDGLREMSDGAIAAYLASVNNRLGEITKTLSVAGTIFIPLTLVASIFGTNFADTYEAWGWAGFWGMCLFMTGCIALLVVWFHARRWL